MRESSKEEESRLEKRGLNEVGFDPPEGHREFLLPFFKLRSQKDTSRYIVERSAWQDVTDCLKGTDQASWD